MNNPKIRFKGYTEDWEQRKFGDLGSVSMCKRIFKEQTTVKGDIPFYKIGTFGGEPDAFISKELFEEYKEKFQYPKVGDMLISTSGTIGRTVEYTGEEAYFQDSNIVWFNHDERVENSFLKCVYTFVKWSGIEGSTIKRLYNDNFLKTEFSIPSVEEQREIGDYFQQLDNLITLHHRKCEQTKLLKKYMLQNMFPQDGESVPKIRVNGFTDTWEQRKLGTLAEINPKCKLPDAFEYVDLESVAGTEILSHRTELKESAPSRAQRLAQEGDVFYQTVRPYQRNNCIFDKPDRNWVFSTGYAQMRPVNDGYFLLSLLQNDSFVKVVIDRCTGTSYPAINANDLAEIEVNYPERYEEQKQIGTYFRNLDTLITLHHRKCDELQKIKKYMLQNMFS